jgi:hypothetical protein
MGDEDKRLGIGLDRFGSLSMTMAQFPKETDAWRDFEADCEKRMRVEQSPEARRIIVPDEVWDYWIAVADGTSKDYDADGSRIVSG